jgi:hypothetical protein
LPLPPPADVTPNPDEFDPLVKGAFNVLPDAPLPTTIELAPDETVTPPSLVIAIGEAV